MRYCATTPPVELDVQTGLLAVCRLAAADGAPAWARRRPGDSLLALTWTHDELSVVCAQELVPDHVNAERGWSALTVRGPLDLGLTGVLAGLSGTLRDAGVSVFVISTYDTDHLLVPARSLAEAVATLRDAGHVIAGG